MKATIKKTKEAYSKLELYDGINPYMKTLKYHTYVKKDKILNDFEIEYVNKNFDFIPEKINKIVKIAKWFGEKCQEKWGTEFLPEKVLINDLLGETTSAIHVFLTYRKSQEKPTTCFIPKKALLDDFRMPNYNDLDIDFTKYDKILSEKGMTMYEHQKTAVKFMLSRKKCILADDMGLGKTLSICTFMVEGGFKKILIICPASLKSNWKRELKTYVNEDEIGIVNGSDWVENKKCTIINYDIINRFYTIPTVEIIEDNVVKKVKSRNNEVKNEARSKSKLLLENFDLIIIDEAHKLSNNTSHRYEVIDDFIKKSNIQNIVLMTGTPITNRPMNFYHLLSLIDHDLTSNWEDYVKQYCDGKQITPKAPRKNGKPSKPIWITSGASNLDELRERAKNCYIRRVKNDIPDMVERNVLERYYELTSEQRNEYSNLWDEYEQSQYDAGKINLNRDLTEGVLLRMKIAEFMIPKTIELANEILEDGEKVFIGCVYNSEVDKFKEYYGNKAVIYNGSMTIKQKDLAESKFMTDPKTTVFIGNIIASGVGLNLTSASKMIINSISYQPGDLQQLIDRIHRLTQKKDVYAYIQLFSDTISEDIWDKVIKKQLIIDKVIKKESDK